VIGRAALACTLLLGALDAEEEIWISLQATQAGDHGQPEPVEVMGRVSAAALAALVEGRNRDGFLRVDGVCWYGDDGALVANAAVNPGQASTFWVRTTTIERVVPLVGAPRPRSVPAAGRDPHPAEGY
jgi:hypothetical protein